MLTFLQSATAQTADILSHTTFIHKLEQWADMPREELFSKLFINLLTIAGKIALAILVFYVGRWLIKKLNKIVLRIMDKRKLDCSLRTFLSSLVSITLTIILIIMVIGILGFSTTSFVAIFASAGVAIGLALSGTLQNFAGGVMLLLFRPFRVGDYIEAQGQGGTVKAIQLTSTVINTLDNKTIYLPNGAVFSGVINNYSIEATRRIDWSYSMNYGQNMDDVDKFFEDMIKADARILSTPKFNINISAVAGGTITVMVWAWVKHEDYDSVFYDMNERVYKNYTKYNIQLK